MFKIKKARGTRVVVSTPAFHARVRGSVPGFGGLKRNKKCFFSHPRVKVSIAGSLRDREVSVLGLRPPGLEFRILCLEDSVISIISPCSGGSPGPSLAYRCGKHPNILLMPVNYTLCSQHFQSILCFIMAMPPNI